MPKLEIDVWPKEGQDVTDEDWARFLLRILEETNVVAADFPMLTLSVPVVKGKRKK